jgi:alkane 1-monooxygenase
MDHPVRAYAAATLTPVALIAAGALAGGAWAWVAFAYMTLFTFAMDQLIRAIDPPPDPTRELPAADGLSALLALLHFPLLFVVIRALATGGLPPVTWFALFAAAGLFFGQVSNSNAHELIHRTRRPLFELGKWVYISLLFGHHTSAHTKVHHRYAASHKDPNSARENEGFYRFSRRAWIGSFVEGYRAEKADLARRGTGGLTPYVTYCLGAAALVTAATVAYGWAGLGAYLLISWYATTQLLLSDYVQHYGLTRATRENGKLEPVGPQHSWNAGHWFSRHLMLNAPRHSDHHAHPARPYPALAAHDNAPTLPSTLPAMAALALFPKLWRRVMNPVLARYKGRPA